ncbi:SsgA family sporulation/cell division regulator [Streptomyces sp. B6B3]|uniref:SsgA family sporulation/cell division regulator n=1 Tax=Streptomyces sp. B6B3 TaxID=3153570 RepID=UPI00325F4CB9
MSSTDKEPANGAAGRAEHLETVVVEDELELTLVLSDWLTAPVRTCFTYRTDDPYAVHLLFRFDFQKPVRWVFARDLLTAGMSDRAGIADVTVRPSSDCFLTSLSLASPHGRVEVEAPTLSLATWLARTHLAVPAGHEDRHLDLDAAVERLLREPGPPPPAIEGG